MGFAGMLCICQVQLTFLSLFLLFSDFVFLTHPQLLRKDASRLNMQISEAEWLHAEPMEGCKRTQTDMNSL